MDIKRIASQPGVLQDQNLTEPDSKKHFGIVSTPDSIESAASEQQIDQRIADISIDLNDANEIVVAPGTAVDSYGEEIDVGEKRETSMLSEQEAEALAKAKLENPTLNYFTGEAEASEPQIKPGMIPKFFKG